MNRSPNNRALDVPPMIVSPAIEGHAYVSERRYLRMQIADKDIPWLAYFSTVDIAVKAIRILRRDDWLRIGEMMFEDEDFLSLQVLARKVLGLSKAKAASDLKDARDHHASVEGNAGFMRVARGAGLDVSDVDARSSLSLDDLL